MRLTARIGLFLLLLTVMIPVMSAQNVTLTHLVNSNHGVAVLEYVETMAREFEAMHPGVTIEVELVSGSRNYLEQVRVRHAAGMAPDILDFNENWGGRAVRDDVFLDLRPYLEKHPDLVDELLPLAVDGFTWLDGTVWGLPIEGYPNVTIYNNTLLQEMGLAAPIDLGDAWDWATFHDYSRRVTRDIDGDGANDRWGTVQLSRQWAQGTTIGQAGGSIVDRRKDPTKVLLTSPAVAAAVEHLLDMVRYDIVGPSGSFQRGETAFQVAQGPGWIWNSIQQGALMGFDWGLARPLHGPDNNGTLVALIGFQISNQTKHPDLAWEWIYHLAGTHEAQMKYASVTGRVPVLRSAIQGYADAVNFPHATAIEIFHAASHPNSFYNIVGGAVDIQTEAGELNKRVLEGGENPTTVLQEMQERIQALLDSFK